MPDLPTIAHVIAATKSLEAWLDKTAARHEALLASAFSLVNRRSQGALLEQLEVEAGRLLNTRENLAAAQRLHREFAAVVEATLGKWRDTIYARDLDRVLERAAKFLTVLSGRKQAFSGADQTLATRLKKLRLGEVDAIASSAVDRLAGTTYEHLVSGAKMAELRRSVKNEMLGIEGMVGKPLAAQAQVLTGDALRNHQNQLTLYKAAKVGLTTFIYYGDVIRDSRAFCVAHAGEVMDDARIAELDTQWWAGKSGPFRTHRGGWNCRHFFVPTSPAWTEGREDEIQAAFTGVEE